MDLAILPSTNDLNNLSFSPKLVSQKLITSSAIQQSMILSHTHPASKQYGFRIEGHRGFGRYEAENTHQAYDRAIEAKLDGIEIDIWLTKDLIPVVIHTAGGDASGVITFDDGTKKLVYEMTFGEIRSRTILSGSLVPSFEGVLRQARNKICVNVELKGQDLRSAEIVLKAIQEENMLDQVQFSSFHWKYYEALKEAADRLQILQKLPFGFLAETEDRLNEGLFYAGSGNAITLKWNLLLNHRELTLKMIEQAKQKGYVVKIFFPFSTPETLEIYTELEALGVETVITNEPSLCINYFTSKI